MLLAWDRLSLPLSLRAVVFWGVSELGQNSYVFSKFYINAFISLVNESMGLSSVVVSGTLCIKVRRGDSSQLFIPLVCGVLLTFGHGWRFFEVLDLVICQFVPDIINHLLSYLEILDHSQDVIWYTIITEHIVQTFKKVLFLAYLNPWRKRFFSFPELNEQTRLR